MPAHKLTGEQHRALDMLCGSTNGCTQALMMAHGFTADLLADLILNKLASADSERMMAGGKVVNVMRLQITDEGRVALER